MIQFDKEQMNMFDRQTENDDDIVKFTQYDIQQNDALSLFFLSRWWIISKLPIINCKSEEKAGINFISTRVTL